MLWTKPDTRLIDNYNKMVDQEQSELDVAFTMILWMHYLFYLIKYEAHIQMLRSNSFSEPLYQNSKPCDFK